MCLANASEFGSDWADFVTRRRSDAAGAEARRTAHARQPKCLIFARAVRGQKIPNLLQMPRFRL
jgi:hypothetical protein